MKKILTLFFILACSNVWAAPNNSMSITNPVSGETISASDESTRYNEVTGKYNVHTHTDIGQVDNTLKLGDGNSGNKTIQANNTDSNLPFIRYDDTNDIWVVSRDGTNVQSVVVMSGTVVDKSILPESPSTLDFLQFSTSNNPSGIWEATSTPDINGGTIDGVTIGASAAPTVTNLGTVTTADINGGTIDGSVIGGSSAAAGTFTTLAGTTKTTTPSAHLSETTAPSTAASEGALYTKDTSGQPELFYREESSGDEVQMTSGGRIYGDLYLVSTTTVSGSNNSGDITISADKKYLVTMEYEEIDSTADSPFIRFNSSSSAIYDFVYRHLLLDATPTEATVGQDGSTQIEMGPSLDETNGFWKGHFFIDTNKSAGNVSAFVYGNAVIYQDTGPDFASVDFWGLVDSNLTVTSFEIACGFNYNATIKLYEIR